MSVEKSRLPDATTSCAPVLTIGVPELSSWCVATPRTTIVARSHQGGGMPASSDPCSSDDAPPRDEARPSLDRSLTLWSQAMRTRRVIWPLLSQ